MHWDAVGCHGVISRTPCRVNALTKIARVLLHRILKSMFQINCIIQIDFSYSYVSEIKKPYKIPLLHIQFTVIVPHSVWLRSSARINIRINSCDENPLVKPHAIAKSLLAVASRLNKNDKLICRCCFVVYSTRLFVLCLTCVILFLRFSVL